MPFLSSRIVHGYSRLEILISAVATGSDHLDVERLIVVIEGLRVDSGQWKRDDDRRNRQRLVLAGRASVF